MQAAKIKGGYISALVAELEDGPFLCPECKSEVILKKGDIYTHHFAHNPGESCAWELASAGQEGTGESELHRLAKKEIYETLSKRKEVTGLKLERYLDSVRPDISFYCNTIPVAIEVQVSAIPPDIITRRTVEYTRRGVYILWTSPFGEAGIRDERAHSTRDWERIIHSIYGGTLYYWVEGDTLLPVHFENARTQESAHQFTLGDQIARIGSAVSITQLEPASLPIHLPSDSGYREGKLWCIPEVWIDKEGRYIPLTEAKAKYKIRYPEVRSFPPLDDPFRAEDIPSVFSQRGFVEESLPELQQLFEQFYQKYGALDLRLIWVSIDEKPNKTYYAADWWQHFRYEYLEANRYKKEMLVEMLQEKLSGERSNRYVK